MSGELEEEETEAGSGSEGNGMVAKQKEKTAVKESAKTEGQGRKKEKLGNCASPFCKNHEKVVRLYCLGLCTCYFDKKKRERFLKWRKEQGKEKPAVRSPKATGEKQPVVKEAKVKKAPAARVTQKKEPVEAILREVDAMRQVAEILLGLEEAMRRNVLEWAAQRFVLGAQL